LSVVRLTRDQKQAYVRVLFHHISLYICLSLCLSALFEEWTNLGRE